MSGPHDEPATTGVGDLPDAARADVVVSRRRLWRGLLVVVPVGALAYTLLVSAPGADEVGGALADLRPRFVLLALVAEAVHLLGMAQAYRAALAAVGGRLAYRQQLAAFVAGNGVGQLLPAGGALGGAVVGARMITYGAPRAAAAAAVALTGTLSLLAVAVLVGVGIAVTPRTGTASLVPGWVPGVVLLALAVVIGTVLVVVRSPALGHRLLDRLEPAMRRVGTDTAAWRSSLDELATSPPTPGGLVRVVAWATLAWAGNATVLWAIFAGLGTPLALDVLLVGFGLQHLVAMVPVSPGGVGVVEAGMAGAYTALGVPGATAVTGVVGYRIVAFWLPVVVGLTTHVRLVVRDAAAARETPDPTSTVGARHDDDAA